MAESNGGGLERRVAALEAARIELEDFLLVHATLESRAAQRIKEHAHFIARHEEIMGEIDDKREWVIPYARRFPAGAHRIRQTP